MRIQGDPRMIIDPTALDHLLTMAERVKDGIVSSEQWLRMAYEARSGEKADPHNLNPLMDALAQHQGHGLIYGFFEDVLLLNLKSESPMRGSSLVTLSFYLDQYPKRCDQFFREMGYNRSAAIALAAQHGQSFRSLWVLQAISRRSMTSSSTALIELLAKGGYAPAEVNLLASPLSEHMLEGLRAAFPIAVSQGKIKAFTAGPDFSSLMNLLYPTPKHFYGVAVGEIFHHLLANIFKYRTNHSREPSFSSLNDIEDTFSLIDLGERALNSNPLMHSLDIIFKRHIAEGMEDNAWSRSFIAPRLEALFKRLDSHSSVWRLVILGHLYPTKQDPFGSPLMQSFDSVAKVLCGKLQERGTSRLPKLLCEMLLSEMDINHVISLLKDDSAALSMLYQVSGEQRLLPMMKNEHRKHALAGDLGL